jgi:hypothetical protein
MAFVRFSRAGRGAVAMLAGGVCGCRRRAVLAGRGRWQLAIAMENSAEGTALELYAAKLERLRSYGTR